jgi:hypothetical protein
MAQIESTIRIELLHSQRSWFEMVSTPGMRKRVLVGSFLGLFTQWSGNTLISYYLNDLLKLIGYTDPNFKGKLNVGLNSWNLVNAVLISLLVRRFPRRKMYLTCATSLLCCYVGWTVAMQRFLEDRSALAAKVTIFFIFAYSPCYNIGYNALTYSKWPHLEFLMGGLEEWEMKETLMRCYSFPRGIVSVCAEGKGNHDIPVLRPRRGILHHVCQSHRSREYQVEVARHILLLARLRNNFHRAYAPFSDFSLSTQLPGMLKDMLKC